MAQVRVDPSQGLSEITQELFRNEARFRQPGAYEQFMEAQDKAQEQATEEARKWMATTGELQTAQGRLSVAQQDLIRKQNADAAKAAKDAEAMPIWTATQQAQQEHDLAAAAAERAHVGLYGAQAGEARAHAGLYGAQTVKEGAQTQAINDWNNRENLGIYKKNASGVLNSWFMGVASGNQQALTSDAVDQAEAASRIVNGNLGGEKFPRNPDGSLDVSKAGNIAARVINPATGQPDPTFMSNLASSTKPTTEEEQLLQAARKAKASGDNEGARLLMQSAVNKATPNLDSLKSQVLMGYLNQGLGDNVAPDIDGFAEAYGKLTQAGKPPPMPPAAAQERVTDGQNALMAVNVMTKMFDDLHKQGIRPVGRFHGSYWDFLASLENSNPDVAAFHAQIMDAVAKYRKFITGKASNEKEMSDLLLAVPNVRDDERAFLSKLNLIRYKTIQGLRTELGTQKSYGYKVPDLGKGFEPIAPADAVKMWGSPDPSYVGGSYMDQAYKNQMGAKAIGAAIARSGGKVGGPGDFRGEAGKQAFRAQLSPRARAAFDMLPKEDQDATMQQLPAGGQ